MSRRTRAGIADALCRTSRTRPTITTAPDTIYHAQGFDIDTPDALAVTKVSLVRLGAATHSFDHDARYLPLSFSATSPTRVRAVAPPSGHIGPPGYYMLFILRDRNPPQNVTKVPSIAKIVRLTPQVTP